MATATVELKPLALGHIDLPLRGTSPLIVHAWSDKAKKMMLDKQMKKASTGKQAKDPDQDYAASLYPLSAGGSHQFPSVAFKASAVRAGTDAGYKMTDLRRAFQIPGTYVEISGVPEMREDMVRVGMGTADIRYRAQFPDWGAVLRITYNRAAISDEQIVNLFEVAGFGVGVGEWRPEKNGQYGMFEVAR